MTELVIGTDDTNSIREKLTGGSVEGCAVLFATEMLRSDGTVRLLVRQIQFPELSDYQRREAVAVELKPHFVARVTKQAIRNEQALVFVHSHLGKNAPIFSPTDDRGEGHLSSFLERRHPKLAHASLVVSIGGMRARRIGTTELVRVISIGTHREILFDPAGDIQPTSDVFDRQVRALGISGQQSLERLCIAIVGLGGTGSIVSQELVHLGVRRFILVDPDTLDVSNLNRVINAVPDDVGHAKVEIAERYIHRIAADATVECIKGDVTRVKAAKELINADLIFGCTDSHGSRAVMQQVSYQYLIPCIDMGSVIVVADRNIKHINGRVQMLGPGLACFTCSGLLDPNQVRHDMMTPFERNADPYIIGAHDPAPAVISINSTIASIAVTMLLSVVAGVPASSRYILYDALNSVLRTVRFSPEPNCFVCSRSGSYGRGHLWPIFGRND